MEKRKVFAVAISAAMASGIFVTVILTQNADTSDEATIEGIETATERWPGGHNYQAIVIEIPEEWLA